MNENQDFTSLMVAVGRIEEKVSRLDGFDNRLRTLEQTVERIEAQQPKAKAPWYSVVGGVVGILSGVATVIALITIISRIPA